MAISTSPRNARGGGQLGKGPHLVTQGCLLVSSSFFNFSMCFLFCFDSSLDMIYNWEKKKMVAVALEGRSCG